MRNDLRYSGMLELAELVVVADSAMRQLRAERRAAATLALNRLQEIGFAEGVEQQMRREVWAKAIPCSPCSPPARTGRRSTRAPDGSVLWDAARLRT